MAYHPHLKSQLAQIGIDADNIAATPLAAWQRLLQLLNESYAARVAGPEMADLWFASVYESCCQKLAEEMDDVVFFLDHQHCWRFVNPAWTRRTGYTVTETLGSPITDFLHPTEREHFLRRIHGQTDETSNELEKIRIRTKTNGYRLFRLHLGQILNPADALMGNCGLLIDLSRRRRRQPPLPVTPNKPAPSPLLRDILDNLAHDFRTPLSVVSSYLYLARRQVNEENQLVKYLDIAIGQAERLATILNEITVFADFEAQRETYTFARVSLNEVLNEVILQQLSATRAKRLGMQAIFAADLPEISGDRIWLVRLAKNLVANAIQYTAGNGEIRVATHATSTHVVLEIADTGAGIADTELQLIFNEFYRIERHRPTASGGAGLGLTIVKKIVDAHRGEIIIESAVGKGTTVTVRFPRI